MRRKLIGALLILLLTGAAYRVLGVYRIRTGECSPRPATAVDDHFPKRLRVMSYNIQGHAALLRDDHIRQVAETIRKHHPDIVAINEAHRTTWQARFHDQVRELERLTGLRAAFGTSYRFLGGDFGNAVLTRGEVVQTDVHALPGVGEPRSLLETTIRINGGTVSFYVTHTSAWGKLGGDARKLQLACVREHVRASRHPFILAGDLNAGAEAPEIEELLAGGLFAIAGDPAAPTHRLTEERLDYILPGGGWNVAAAAVLDDGPSDHRPLVAELTH